MSANRRLPRAGDRSISARFLKDLDEKLDRMNKFNGVGGMSYGAGGIALPDLRDDESQLKLIYTDYAPGAFGGFADSYGEIGDNQKALDAKTAIIKGKNDDGGKLRPTLEYIKLFPGRGWFYEAGAEDLNPVNGVEGNLAKDPDTEKLVNPGRFPIRYGSAWCVPAAKDPDTWVIVAPLTPSLSPFAWWWNPNGFNGDPGNDGVVEPLVNASDWSTPKILRYLWAADNAGLGIDPYSAASYGGAIPIGHAAGDAVFLNVPGLWEIQFGGQFSFYAGADPYDSVQYDVAGGGGGSITLLQHPAVQVEMQCQFNMNGTTPISNDDFYHSIAFPPATGIMGGAIGGSGGTLIEIQSRPAIFSTRLDNPHGNHYTRINLAIRAKLMSSIANTTSTKPKVKCLHAHLYIRPAGGDRSGLSSCGYNPYLGKKTKENPKGLQWWGGGDPPKAYDQQGLIIVE